MADFAFLTACVHKEDDNNNDLQHSLYPLSVQDIKEVEAVIEIPAELKRFYKSIGYGFFHRKSDTAINRLMDPYSFKQLNVKETFYEFDSALEVYDTMYHGEKVLFFEVNEGIYLAIDRQAKGGKNAVYYYGNKIADSLEEFLTAFVGNANLIAEFD